MLHKEKNRIKNENFVFLSWNKIKFQCLLRCQHCGIVATNVNA